MHSEYRCHFVTVALYLSPTLMIATPTNLQVVILSGASLEVKWEPAPDTDQVNVDSSVTLSSLQELTVYNVSVQAVNSGGPSRSLTAAVRMVTVGQLGRTEVQH